MRYYKKSIQGFILIFASLLIPFMMWGCSDVNLPSTAGQTNPNPNPVNPVGTIQGKLVDRVTLAPISGAIIDIGVAKATTSDTGQFTMANVPATQDAAKGTVTGSYSATIDLREVNKQIDAENAKLPQGSTPKAKYPDFAYDEITVEFTSLKESETLNVAESQHDTPVDKLIARKDLSVGKLAANIEGVVAGCSGKDFFKTVGSGYTVKLYTDSSSNTTASGARGRLIGQTTTDGNGKYSFSNVEAGLPVTIYATSADGTLEDSTSVTIPTDGETLKLTDIQQSVTLHVCSNDVHGPEIVSVTPEVGSDQPQGSISVVLTFSEAVKQTAKTGTDPSGIDNLYDHIEVMFDGSKAGNVAYSLAWDTPEKLTVTIPNTGTSSLYHVRLKDIDAVFADANGLPAALGVCPDDSAVPLKYGVTEDPDDNDCTVYFTTNGGTTPGIPVVSLVNAASLDQAGGNTTMILDWDPVSGAKNYNIYCAPIQVWNTTPQNGAPQLVDIVGTSQATVDVGTFVENNDIKLKYECFVRPVNSDGVEFPDKDSNKVTAEDKVGPKLVAYSGVATFDPHGNITDITLGFNELLDSASAQTNTNYTISASGTAPTVTSAVYDYTGPSVKLTLSAPLDPANLTPGTIGPGDNGVIDSTPLGDDVVIRPTCVDPGSDKFLETTNSGDDEVVLNPSAGNSINVGPNGICESSIVSGNDTQVLAVGKGKPNSICITAGANGIMNTTTAAGDDVKTGTNINSGPDGVCNTTAAGDDSQVILVGNGLDATSITAGNDLVINSTLGNDDVLTGGARVKVSSGVKDIAGNAIDPKGDQYNTDDSVE